MKALYIQIECIVKSFLKVFESMRTIDPILERMRDAAGVPTDKELCEKIDFLNYATLDTWKNRDNIPDKKLRMIAKFLGVDHLFLEFGEIDVLGSSDNAPNISNQMIKAPIMSVKASAGRGNEHYEVVTTGELLIDRMLFKILPNLKNIRAIEVEGDSMYPTLKEGDYVVIEENNHFSGDGIYVLQWDSVLLVKRLQAGAKKIDIISDNQSYAVNTFNPTDDQRSFHIVGKVILRMQR